MNISPLQHVSTSATRGLLLAVLGIAAATHLAHTQEIDTVGNTQPSSSYYYFSSPEIVLQATRITNPTPCLLREVEVTLGGWSETGSARLRIFGSEGGAEVPFIERDLTQPIRIQKTRRGFEKISVVLPTPVYIEHNQFFVAIDELDSATHLLSDKIVRQPFCESGSAHYYYQALKTRNGAWEWKNNGFAIKAIVERPSRAPKNPMSNVAYAKGIVDTMRANKSIAWADYDDDGYLDLLWDGRLYRNDEAERFVLMNDSLQISGHPRMNAFCDLNNDQIPDIVFIKDAIDDEEALVAYLSSNGAYSKIVMNQVHLDDVVGYGFADINQDGYLDLAVATNTIAADERIYMTKVDFFVNDRNGNLTTTENKSLNSVVFESPSKGTGMQFIDSDLDGDLDIFLPFDFPANSVIAINDWPNQFTYTKNDPVKPQMLADIESITASRGGDWTDYNSDGNPDLLAPTTAPPSAYIKDSSIATNIRSLDPAYGTYRIQSIPDYDVHHAGGTWGDVNNDGHVDYIIGTSSQCHFTELYLQDSVGNFNIGTFDYGLNWSRDNYDAVWVDFDNDGYLDLSTTEGNRFLLYENNSEDEGNYVKIEPTDRHGRFDPGAKVTVFADGVRVTQFARIGRGRGMGDPSLLHYGIGQSKTVDSISLEWSSGSTQTLYALEGNQTIEVLEGNTSQRLVNSTPTIEFEPNPFKYELTVLIKIPMNQNVDLNVYTADGHFVKNLLKDELMVGAHKVTWNGTSESNVLMPSGAYVIRMISDRGESAHRVILTR